MRKKILFVLIILTISVLSCCMFNEKHAITYIDNETDQAIELPHKAFGASYVDDEISKKLVKEINELDAKVVDAIVNNDLDAIMNMLNQDLEIDEDTVSQIIESYSEIMTDSNYEYFARHYFETIEYSEASRAVSTSADGESDVIVEAVDGEVFVSMMKYKYAFIDELLIVEYINEGEKWYIRDLSLSAYAYNGNSAMYHYEKAKELYDNGEYLQAYLHAYTSYDLTLGVSNFRYRHLSDIENVFSSSIDKLNGMYEFPIIIDDAGGVLVYSLRVVNAPDALMPCFEYGTKYEMSADGNGENDEKISEEIHIVHNELMKQFPEISEYNSQVIYYAMTAPGSIGPAYKEVVDIE